MQSKIIATDWKDVPWRDEAVTFFSIQMKEFLIQSGIFVVDFEWVDVNSKAFEQNLSIIAVEIERLIE